jgi:hypothetical protein
MSNYEISRSHGVSSKNDGISLHDNKTEARKSGKTGSGKSVSVVEAPRRFQAPKLTNLAPVKFARRMIRQLGPRVDADQAKQAIDKLKGATIKPEVAEAFLDRIKFDHLGRIVGAVEPVGRFSPDELVKLQNGAIADPSRTNSPERRDAPRIETDVIVDFVVQLGDAARLETDGVKKGALQDLAKEFKTAWLKGDTGAASVAARLNKAAKMLGSINPDLSAAATSLRNEVEPAEDKALRRLSEALNGANPQSPELKTSIETVSTSIRAAFATGKSDAEKRTVLDEAIKTLTPISTELGAAAEKLRAAVGVQKPTTLYHDNVLGRRFETELVNVMVGNPPAPVLAAANKLGQGMLNELAKLSKNDAEFYLVGIAAKLKADSRPWASELPHVLAFIQDPSLENFKTMMTTNTSGFDVVKQSWVGVKFALTVPMPWGQTAIKNYNEVILPARSMTPSVLAPQSRDMPESISQMFAAINEAKQRMIGLPTTTKEYRARREAIRAAEAKLNSEDWSLLTLASASKLFSELRADLHTVDPTLANASQSIGMNLHKLAILNPSDPIPRLRVDVVGLQTDTFGTALPHQPRVLPDGASGVAWQSGPMMQAKINMSVEQPSPFEATGLAANRHFVSGASGSTNIMVHMASYFMQTDSELKMDDVFAGVMMFLTYDGGHSLSESTGTYRSLFADPRDVLGGAQAEILANRKAALETHVADFTELPNYFGSADTRNGVQTAVDEAFNRMTSAFDLVHVAQT